MNGHTFTLSVRGSKAIESADIVLDEITVLSGVNAAGKSTIARMFNLLVNLSQNYPVMAQRQAWKRLQDAAFQIRRLSVRLDESVAPFDSPSDIPRFEERVGKGDFSMLVGELRDYTTAVLDKYESMSKTGNQERAFHTFLRGVGIGVECAANIQSVRDILSNKFEKAIVAYKERCAKREYAVYNNTMGHEVDWLVDADSVTFKEGDEIVYQTERNPSPPPKAVDQMPLKEVFGIKKAFYIASPWYSVPSIDKDGNLLIPGDEFVHRPTTCNVDIDGDLFDLLQGSFDEKELSCQASAEQSPWVYRRRDGLVVDLKDCATGIKSLAILNLLYARKYLDSETLLIIDEPEVHLHPQWIAEYAKILVQICSKLKVRLLLTSHSPDMVSAIKVMAEAEGVDGVNFYWAEESKSENYKFRYLHLNNTIEKIFESFGKSIEAIDNYKPYGKQ